jgi:predicted lactoylglutathione lyase
MAMSIFANLAVKDLKASMAFFASLGWKNNPQFTDETAACIVISDTVYAMLLTHEKFESYSHGKKVADTAKTQEVLISLSVDSKQDVHRLVDAAVKAGATEPEPMQDYGFMISRSFHDLDGHAWSILHMDPTYVLPT